MKLPGIVISALRGGSGKTLVSIGMIAALKQLGKTVAPFKKGPDYIDAGWLSMAAGRHCYNLDTFLIDQETILKNYSRIARNSHLSIIEGNRGLFDCIDLDGTTSTAELAKLLSLPVVLCVDGSKITRTMAAVVSGCQQFDPDLNIAGVILNHVAGARHEKILRDSIESHCKIPVLGSIPKLGDDQLPERHMGLVPTVEHGWAESAIQKIVSVITKNVDLKAVFNIALNGGMSFSPEHDGEGKSAEKNIPVKEKAESVVFSLFPKIERPARIGVVKDSAFQFYYQENLEALEDAGAELVFTSPLKDFSLPKVDALYIGGGFPETHALQLSQNTQYAAELKELARIGLPIYAECGGLLYLGEELVINGSSYPMVGIFPVVFGFSKRPKGHGYTVVHVKRNIPFFDMGSTLKGHEFHYSHVIRWSGEESSLAFELERGTGFINGKDGLLYNNVFASYMHVHALSVSSWAHSFVKSAVFYKLGKNKKEEPSLLSYFPF